MVNEPRRMVKKSQPKAEAFAGRGSAVRVGAQGLITTIIPTRNRQKWLERALSSVAQQGMPGLKVIVVDDASSEPAENRAVLARFEDQLELDYRYLPQAAGAGGARNAGIRAAREDFIAFLDDDDLWHASKLRKQLDRFQHNPDGVRNLGVVCTWHQWTDDVTGRVLFRRRPRLRTLDDVFRWNYNMIQTVMIRRECLEEVGGFDESAPKENLDLHARLIQHCGYDTVPEILVTCFRHSGPRASDGTRQRLQGLQIVLDRYGSFVNDRRVLHDPRYRLGRLLLQTGQFGNARRELAEAVRIAPLTRKPLYLLFWAKAALDSKRAARGNHASSRAPL